MCDCEWLQTFLPPPIVRTVRSNEKRKTKTENTKKCHAKSETKMPKFWPCDSCHNSRSFIHRPVTMAIDSDGGRGNAKTKIPIWSTFSSTTTTTKWHTKTTSKTKKKMKFCGLRDARARDTILFFDVYLNWPCDFGWMGKSRLFEWENHALIWIARVTSDFRHHIQFVSTLCSSQFSAIFFIYRRWTMSMTKTVLLPLSPLHGISFASIFSIFSVEFRFFLLLTFFEFSTWIRLQHSFSAVGFVSIFALRVATEQRCNCSCNEPNTNE